MEGRLAAWLCVSNYASFCAGAACQTIDQRLLHSLLQGMAWEGVLCEWYQVGSAREHCTPCHLSLCEAALPGLLRLGSWFLAVPLSTPPAPSHALQTRSENWAYGFISNLKGDFRWNGNQASCGMLAGRRLPRAATRSMPGWLNAAGPCPHRACRPTTRLP